MQYPWSAKGGARRLPRKSTAVSPLCFYSALGAPRRSCSRRPLTAIGRNCNDVIISFEHNSSICPRLSKNKYTKMQYLTAYRIYPVKLIIFSSLIGVAQVKLLNKTLTFKIFLLIIFIHILNDMNISVIKQSKTQYTW